MSNNPQKYKIKALALLGTLLFHGGILLILLLTVMYPAVPSDLAEKADDADSDAAEILFGDEYVQVGDLDILAADNTANNPAANETQPAPEDNASADGFTDHGPQGDEPSNISSKQPSPSTVTPRVTDNPGSKKDNDTKKPSQPAQQGGSRINSDYVNFGDRSDNAPSGNAGSPSGNADHGATSGQPGFNVPGRTAQHWGKPSSNYTGTIVVNVVVNKSGRVTSASVDRAKSTGRAASDGATRESCLQAARASQFSVLTDGSSGTSGTITYRFH